MKNRINKTIVRLWITLLVLTVSGINAGATEWPITNTAADAIELFIENTAGWVAGDTILISDASTYIVNGTVDIFQDITIMAAPGLAQKPVLKFNDNGFKGKAEGISITIKGLKLDGYKEDGSRRNHMLRFDQPSVDTFNIIKIEDCEVWGFKGGIQLYKNTGGLYNELIIDNCIFYDMSGDYVIDPRINAVKKLEITNSTFYDISHGFLKNPYFVKPDDGRTELISQNFLVDHCTFFRVVGDGNNALIQINDPTDGSVTFTFSNNIVDSLWSDLVARPFRINADAGTFQFRNSTFFEYFSSYQAGIHNLDSVAFYQANVSTSDIYRDDPLFADSENRDFSIPSNSPLVTASTTGGAIGDPRWAPEVLPWTPGPNVHMIPNTQADTLERFIEQHLDLWAPGDTILVTSPNEYIVNGTVDFFQEVTVMGDPRLDVKPTLRFNDNGFRAKEDSINITIKGLKLNGYKSDESRCNHMLRFDQAGWYNYKSIIVEDCEVWGFKGGIQLYKNSGTLYEELIINNCIFHDLSGDYVVDPRINAVKNLDITNSTFYDISHGFLKNPYFVKPDDGRTEFIAQDFLVDHCTFFRVGGDGSNALIQINDPNDGSVTFTFSNNIVDSLWNNVDARPFRINPDAGTFVFAHSLFHEYYSLKDAGIHNLDYIAENLANVTTSDILDFYPGFADTLNRYMMLPDTSSLISAGTDGGPIGDPRWVPQGGVTIRALEEAVVEGDVVQLLADVVLEEGSDLTLTWTVENNYGGTTGQATIDAFTGELSTSAAGKVLVTASSNHNPGFNDELEVTIDAKILVTDITLSAVDALGNPTTEITNIAGFVTVSAVVTPGNAHDQSISWSLSGDAKASISEVNAKSVQLLAIQCGTATVTATANDGSGIVGTLDIEISGQTPVQTVTVSANGGTAEITEKDGTLQMTSTVTPDTACIQEVTWTINDDVLASISETGLLTAKADGTVTVTARAKDGSYKSGTLDVVISGQNVGLSNKLAKEISIYPNPAQNQVFVDYNKRVEVVIHNIVGLEVQRIMLGVNEPIDISSLTSGIYLVNIKVDSHTSIVRMVKD